MYLESKTERIFGIACLEKSSYFNRNIDFFAYSFFKNIEISPGQGVVQSEPKPLWSIPWVPRV